RPEAVSAARRALDGFDELLDLGVFYDASLCVSELVTNAVIHAGLGEESELRLDVDIDTDTLRVSVTDPGRGFEPEEPAPGDESGWGLYIVDRLSHRWGVDRRGGTRVWFEMAVNSRRPQSSGADEGDFAGYGDPEDEARRTLASVLDGFDAALARARQAGEGRGAGPTPAAD